MKHRIRLRDINVRIFILPFIIITLIFIAIAYKFNVRIKEQYYNLKEEEAKKIAISYSTTIAKSAKAIELLNKQLEERILLASKATILYDEHISNELLSKLANSFSVDEIYFYNSEGEIINSNTGDNIGWKTYEGHSAYDFMKSPKTSYVERIRQNVITGILYKYGYFKADDGCFVQIGVLADKIEDVYNTFDIQKFLNNIKDDDISEIFLLDKDFAVISSTNEQLIGDRINNNVIRNNILSGELYGFDNKVNGVALYEIYVPVNVSEEIIGTLGIRYSLKNNTELIDGLLKIGIVAIVIIYLSLIYVLSSTYKNNKKLVKMAYHDSLTGLPNIEYLNKFMEKELKKHKNNRMALIVVRLNNIGLVNLTLGYTYGDIVLKKFENRLSLFLNKNLKLYRTANKFIILVRKYKDTDELIKLVESISHKLEKPLNLNGSKRYISTQIGIYEIQNNNKSVEDMLKKASIASNNVNLNGFAKYAFFNEDMQITLQREEIIEREIRAAIADNRNEDLSLEYQPLLDLKTNNIVSFEALARFRSTTYGKISPVEFIDIAERTQLIIPLSNFILRKACQFIAEVNEISDQEIKVAVNISGIHLIREDFIDTVINIIEETGINSSKLELEITESVFLNNYDLVNEKLKSLREYKICIALDDFGTGYSSFARLKELNIDILKIDKYFISKVDKSVENDSFLIGEIISIAHKLGLIVVAEGVELEEQLKYLMAKGGDILQGYIFSKPLPAEEAKELLNKGTVHFI